MVVGEAEDDLLQDVQVEEVVGDIRNAKRKKPMTLLTTTTRRKRPRTTNRQTEQQHRPPILLSPLHPRRPLLVEEVAAVVVVEEEDPAVVEGEGDLDVVEVAGDEEPIPRTVPADPIVLFLLLVRNIMVKVFPWQATVMMNFWNIMSIMKRHMTANNRPLQKKKFMSPHQPFRFLHPLVTSGESQVYR